MNPFKDAGPILRALSRNKIGAVLIALQIAMTMTIIVNSVYIINERYAKMHRDSGIDEANSFYLRSVGFGENFNNQSTIEEDIRNILAVPGVRAAMQINAIPLSGSGWSMSLQREPGADAEDFGTAVYFVDETALEVFDLELVAGEFFSMTDINWRQAGQSNWSDKVVISQALAERLFGDEDWPQGVGKTVYIEDKEPMVVVGIVDKIQAPWSGWDDLDQVMLSPEQLDYKSVRYFIRAEEGRRDEVMQKVESMLAENTQRVIRQVRTMEETRERSYRSDSAMIKILTTVMITLTIVTALGIVGLASFSVNRRKKQIGTRRALGATKSDILRYFMLENFLISTIGVVIGAGLTMGLNIVLVNTFGMDPMQWYYIPIGMVVLWCVGQLAVFGPAQRAAGTPPAIATRTV